MLWQENVAVGVTGRTVTAAKRCPNFLATRLRVIASSTAPIARPQHQRRQRRRCQVGSSRLTRESLQPHHLRAVNSCCRETDRTCSLFICWSQKIIWIVNYPYSLLWNNVPQKDDSDLFEFSCIDMLIRISKDDDQITKSLRHVN